MTSARQTPDDEATAISLEPRDRESLRACLERTLREMIRERALRPGVRMPASRTLARQLGVSRGVVSDAYTELAAQGFLVSVARRAPLVAPVAPAAARRGRTGRPAQPPVRFDMTPTSPDTALFPRARWAAELADAARRAPASALDYGDVRGSERLRAALADELGRTRGVICEPDQVIVVQGATQGLDLALRTLAGRGVGSVAVEDPSLDRQRLQIRALGLALRAQPVGDEGVVVDGLNADAVIVSPAHQYPTGAVLSGSRRRELIAWSRATGSPVIEDDYDAEFRYDRQPVRALQGLHPDGVLYLGTTSKTLAPGLRLGWLVAPRHLVQDLAKTKALLDDGSPALEQLAFASLLEHGHHQRHIRRARALYRARRDRLVHALAERFPSRRVSGVAAGLSVTLELDRTIDDLAVQRRARAAGIALEALSRYAIVDRGRRGLVLGYGRLHESAAQAAVHALSDAVGAQARLQPRP